MRNSSNPPTHDKPPGRQRPLGGSWVEALLAITTELKLNESDRFRQLVHRIAIKGDEKAAELQVRRLLPALYSQRLEPDAFLSMETDIDGEIQLGLTRDGRRVGIGPKELVRHVAFFGASGSGKSTQMLNVFLQLHTAGYHTVYMDRKGDCPFLAREYPHVYVVPWAAIRDNPLAPPSTECDILEWRNDFIRNWAELTGALQRGQSVVMQALDALFIEFQVYEKWAKGWDWSCPFPTMLDLLNLLKSKWNKRILGQGRESLFSIIEKMTALVTELRPIVDCQRGISIERLYRERRAVAYVLSGLGPEAQGLFITTTIRKYSKLFRSLGQGDQGLRCFILFDEAKSIFSRINQHSLTIKDAVSTVRADGVGLGYADQVPTEIMPAVLSNTGTVMCWRLSSGADIQMMRVMLSETERQAASNFSLDVGEFVVRSGRFRDLHRVKVQQVFGDKHITRQELEELVAPTIRRLHEDVLYQSASRATQQPVASSDSVEELLLAAIVRNFQRPASDIYKQLGLGDSTGFRAKEKLVASGLITQIAVNQPNGKRAIFLVPEPEVLEAHGVPIDHRGRGGVLHKTIQASLAKAAKAQGWEAALEVDDVDVSIAKGGVRVGVQISVTSTPKVEAHNAAKVLETHDRAIVAFVSAKAMHRAKAIAIAEFSDETATRLCFCLIGQVLERLG